MKKIISIISILVLIFSLTACSNKSDSPDATPVSQENSEENKLAGKEQKIEKYINEKSLNNTDNISFLFDSINDNEYFILNLKSPNLLNNIKFDNKGMHGDAIDIEEFNNDGFINFTLNGYRFNLVTRASSGEGEVEYQTWKPENYQYEGTIISEDGYFMLVEEREKKEYDPYIRYVIWAKAKNQYIRIDFCEESKIFSGNKDDYAAAYNIVKECFTFATVSTSIKTKNSILWEIPDLKTATIFGEEQPTSSVNDWVFANDLRYKELENNGIYLLSSNNLNLFYAEYNFSLTDADRELGLDWNNCFSLRIDSLEEGDSYDMGKTVKEFNIGSAKFKLLGIDDSYGGFALKIKTKTGAEYACNIDNYGREYESDLDYVQYYLEKVFSTQD